ncbi:MMPL family transporter [bacterium]|nr:MMPL family transporter [bacterium]
MIRFPPKPSFVYKNYVTILAIAVLLTAGGGYYAAKLTLESDLAKLIPSNYESVKALERIKEEVGGVGNIKVIIEAQDIGAAKAFAEELGPKLLASPIVNYLDYKNDVAFYKKNGLLFLELDELDSLHTAIQDKIGKEKQKLNPLFVDDLFGDEVDDEAEGDWADWESKYQGKEPKEYYINEDSTALFVKVIPTGTNTDLKFVQQFYDEVRGIVEAAEPQNYSPPINILYAGNFITKLDEYAVVKKDILGTAFYGFGGVFLLIIIYFRRLLGALLITVSLLMSLAWTFGITYLVIGNLNTITGFLFVILFGLGVDYGIHAFARYAESRRSGLSFEHAIEKVVSQTGRALTTTAVTTSAAFFSLTVMDFKGFSELGFIAGLGILFALIAMVVVLPALITAFEKLRFLKFSEVPSQSTKFDRREFRYARPALLLSVGVTLFAMYSFFQVRFEYDFTNLRANVKQREMISQKSEGAFDLSESPAVVLADSKAEIDEIFQAVRRIMKRDTLSPTVDDVKSTYSLVPDDQPEKLVKIREIRELIEEEAEGVVTGDDKERLDKLNAYLQVSEPFRWDHIPEQDRRKFINKKGEVGNFVFIYPGVALRDGKNAIEFRNDIGEITTSNGQTYHASSSNIILADMLLILIREGRIAVLLTFAVVFLIVFIDLRDFKSTIFVLTPLVLALLWMAGVMYLLGMKLNLFNIVVLPSVIGIGVDNGVHIYHRYREEGRGSLYFVLKTTGLAITMTTLTTIVGYSGLILASHPGLNSIGDLAIIGIGLAFVTAMFVLPSLLQFFERKADEPEPAKALQSTV